MIAKKAAKKTATTKKVAKKAAPDEENELKPGSGKPGAEKPSDEQDSATPREDPPAEPNNSEVTDDSSKDMDKDAQTADQITMHHYKVVELASRLAAAQMAAEASMKSARLTVSGIQRVAAAYVMASARIKMNLETVRSNPDMIDAAFVDRAYADLLSAAEVQELPLDKATPLNHPDHDDLFEGAMFRAQRLLRPSTEDTTLIHAEQMFDAEEILSENQVGKRFEECLWPKLETHAKSNAFMVRVERWLHDHLCRLYFPEEDEQYAKDADIMKKVLDVGRRRQESDLFRKIYDLVRSHEPPNRPKGVWTDIEEMSDAMWTQCLIDVICCGRSPSHTRENEKRTLRYYRPWGLFRFLRIHGTDDPVGSELLGLLACERRDLALDAVVHPFRQNYPSDYDFGPLDRLVSEREHDEMWKASIQSAVKLEAASGLLDAVQTLESLPKLIAEKFQKDVLHLARSGKPFDPKWTETIKDGFKAILLAGTECHMDRMIEFLTKFYLPLLDAYGALNAVEEYRFSAHSPHELIDLFPDGWSVSLSRTIGGSVSPPDASANQEENEKNSQAAESMILTLQSGTGEKRSVPFD